MKTTFPLTALILGLAAVPAMAQPASPPRTPDCLRIANIWDYTPVPGNRALIVTDRARRDYKLTFLGRCTGLQFHTGLAFKSMGVGGLSCMEKGDKVITHDVAGPPECIISSVLPYTPQMRQADAEAAAKAAKP